MDKLPAWVEVDLDAMKWNIDRIKSFIPDDVKILLVVKADAYGHGAVRISRFAAGCGVHMLGVATLDEGKELRKSGITLPILILSPVLPQELDAVLENDLAVTASTYNFALEASRASQRVGLPCALHVEVDTGMGRAGLSQDRAIEIVERMKDLEGLRIEGIFTHFPASDIDVDFTEDQIRSFTNIVERLKQSG
ncbi:MAG: alanine racemase, partial [Candidatus Krumholzibacteria bacterium]|nr:alanine racemase [Candidatus Krumholzibacteria bacterium]